jgi:hypothetical protein
VSNQSRGSDRCIPAPAPDKVIDALRARECDGAIDLPEEKRRRKNPGIGDRVQIVSSPSVGHPGSAPECRVGRDAVELV